MADDTVPDPIVVEGPYLDKGQQDAYQYQILFPTKSFARHVRNQITEAIYKAEMLEKVVLPSGIWCSEYQSFTSEEFLDEKVPSSCPNCGSGHDVRPVILEETSGA